MRIHLSRRHTIIAATAATVALGSAAAYAITLPQLPVKLPGFSLDLPLDLPNPLISPPDTHLPANPIVGPPDGDELSDVTKVLDPLDPKAPPKQGPGPVARPPAPAPQAVQAAHSPSGGELKDLDEDWAKWARDHADGSISVTIGRGINICNNNNVKVIVDRDSSGDENTIEQHSSNGNVVTTVNGEETDSTTDLGSSCLH